jgi:HK97 family phage major capsid protein
MKPNIFAAPAAFVASRPNVIVAGSRPRGIIGAVRADASDPKAILAELQKAVAEQRAEFLAKMPDADKVNRLDTVIGELQASMDAQAQAIAALRLGGGGGQPGETPEAREHRDSFKAFMARGDRPQARGATYSEPDGGFLVTPTVDTNVTRVLAATVAMRGLSNVMAISSGSYKKFKSVGGAAANWSGERDSRTETATPTLVEIEITPGELTAEPAANQQLLDDAFVDVEAWYGDELAISFAEKEGEAFIIGDGVKKPRGILGYTPVANADYAWGKVGYIASGHASAFVAPTSSVSPADCLVDLFHALRSGYRANGSWLMSDLTSARVRKFKDGQGNFLWQPSIAVDQPSTLLGKPVAFSDYMPSVGADAFPIAFGDFRQAYTIVERIGMRTLRNPFKTNGVVFFYTTRRVGGAITNFEAIKLLKIATS